MIRIDLDFKNAFNSAGHSCLWAILRGLGVPDVDFLEELYSKSWMKITVGTGCSAPIQLDTGTVQGSVLSPLLFDLFLNALLRLLDATGITHGIKRTSQWNHAAFADDLKEWGILNEVKCRLCEKYYKDRNIPEPPDTVESVDIFNVIVQPYSSHE